MARRAHPGATLRLRTVHAGPEKSAEAELNDVHQIDALSACVTELRCLVQLASLHEQGDMSKRQRGLDAGDAFVAQR